MIVNRVTLLGNKDHGKSTLIGNLMIQTGSVSEQRINDAKKTSKKLERQFEPGYILDSFQEEREREMTIDTTRAQVKYKNTGFEFIDVPGHEELMKNMLSGASYADFALLLVSAKPGEGITSQTKRHIFVAKMFGIDRLIVAVNKLDAVDYSQERFDQIVAGIRSYLEKIGFKDDKVSFIPISAYNAENLVKTSPNMKWYSGKSLIDALISMSKAGKEKRDGELLVSVQGLFEGDERLVFGKVLSGNLKRGESLVSLPNDKSAKVVDIFASGSRKGSAGKGNVVTLRLDKSIGTSIRGSILARRKDACNSGSSIHALLLTTRPINGSLGVKINGVEVKCKKMVVSKAIDIATGECKAAKRIKPLNAGSVDLELDRKVPSDLFERTPEIGRFLLYANKSFAGVGIITN